MSQPVVREFTCEICEVVWEEEFENELAGDMCVQLAEKMGYICDDCGELDE